MMKKRLQKIVIGKPGVKPGRKPSVQFKQELVSADGRVLAYCPNKQAALQTVRAMYGRDLVVLKYQKKWNIVNSDGILVAVIKSRG